MAAMLEIAKTPVRRSGLLMARACRTVRLSNAAPMTVATMGAVPHFPCWVICPTVLRPHAQQRPALVLLHDRHRSSCSASRYTANGSVQAMRLRHAAWQQDLRHVSHGWRHRTGPTGLDASQRGCRRRGAGLVGVELGD